VTVKRNDIKVGDSKSLVVFDNLTRSQIVMYAGASGDYNPLHSDEVFTTNRLPVTPRASSAATIAAPRATSRFVSE